MNFNRFALATLAFVGSLHSVSARSQASLICEDGRIRTESRENSALWACWTSACDAVPITITSNPTWSSHLLTELYAVNCGSSGRASICYENSAGDLIATDSCSESFEAMITVVDDFQRRRELGNLRGLTEEEKEEGETVDLERKQCERVTKIGEETWTVLGPC